jgi:preprotein translocase subunit SecE
MSYHLDAVYVGTEVVLNANADDTIKFIKEADEETRRTFWVVRGQTLRGYTANDYLLYMGETP